MHVGADRPCDKVVLRAASVVGHLQQRGSLRRAISGDGGPAIEQIPELPIWLWAVMLAGIGGAEQIRIAKGFQKLDPSTQTASRSLREGYYPGDLGFDPLNLAPEDPAEFRLMQEKELSHGRLAMIAAAGFLAQEAVSGQTWGAYWGDASF